jgi:hypothetical protein
MLTPGHSRAGSRLLPFGSFRASPRMSAEATPRPGARTVVVLPVGNPVESVLLFETATKTAALCQEYRFVFLCHPVMPYEKVRSHLSIDPDSCRNIEISTTADITDDFKRASVILYRGSSTVLYAVMFGLKPLYLHSEAHADIDPLFELDRWREPVFHPANIAERLRAYAGTAPAHAEAEWCAAREYVNGYVRPVDDAAITRFLEALSDHDRS